MSILHNITQHLGVAPLVQEILGALCGTYIGLPFQNE